MKLVIDAELLDSEAVVMPALRLLFLKHAHPGLLPGSPVAAPHAGGPAPAVQATSWTETFAPKLDAATISALKTAFEISYPSEALEPEFMPSTRLLSHVHKMVASKDLAFVPWKFRMSVKLHEEHQSLRPAKKARLELSDLLLDEVPSRDIPASGTIGVFHLQQLLSLLSVSLALCKAAHLQTLRTYERAFMRLAGTRYSADSGLRAPHVEELQAADRQFWYEVNALFQKGWKHPFGIPDASASQLVRLQNSLCLLERSVSILLAVFQAGGHTSLEQPPNALSWQQSMVQHYLLEVSATCCCIAACAFGMNVHKRWMFATSFAGLSALACVCSHER